jgi:hypothetical protein
MGYDGLWLEELRPPDVQPQVLWLTGRLCEFIIKIWR